jgi:hypothetical protein
MIEGKSSRLRANPAHISKHLPRGPDNIASIFPWLDRVDLREDMPVCMQQEELIETIPATAVCVGKQAIERGQARPIYAFIDQFVQRRVPVIPLLLADTPARVATVSGVV